ncbi:unnamed protein product [Caenorhabditis sp. 36 PRJEB53466]|nr:unnamed protein product [Caenorhabditis sp. 36 PRJEB53466]
MNSTDFTDPLNLIASALMLVNSLFGIACNLLIVYIFVRAPSERTSFNLICVFRAAGNIFILSWAFLGTFIPMTLAGDSLFPPVYQYVVITSVNSIYTALQYSGTIIALNRFCAMFVPLFYSKLFSIKSTAVILILLLGLRISKIFYEASTSIPLQCFSTFSSYDLAWSPDFDPKCNDNTGTIVDNTAIFLGALLLLNIATFIKIYIFYKETEMDEKEVKKKMRKNKILFTQTIIQDVFYLIDMLFTFKLSGLISERYWTFISGSFIWQSVHSLDGLIMLMFNERLTFLKRNLFSTSSSNPSFVGGQLKITGTVSVVQSRSYLSRID